MTLDETLGSGQTGHNSDHAALRAEAAARGVSIAALTPGVSSVLDHALVHQALAVNHNLIGAATVLPETVTYNNQLSTHQVLHKAYNLRTAGSLSLVTPSVVHATAATPPLLSVGAPGVITNLPPQPGSVVYASPGTVAATIGTAYNHPGAMVLASRDQYNEQTFLDISAAGGHVLIYFDTIVWNTTGRYHAQLFNANTIGGTAYPAVPKWPGPVNANSTGDLADFRTTSVMHTSGKLEAVLELIIAENPHMTGFFMDDVGSRSWFPNFNWATFGTTNQNDYRAGAIQVCQTVRNICDAHGLIFMVNGTWTQGTVAASGGGYPTLTTHGNALAEGGCVEHHDGEVAFWGPYMGEATSQWGEQSTITGGKPFCFVITSSSSGVTEYRTDGRAAWVSAAQPSASYNGVLPWGTVSDFHATGLPPYVLGGGAAVTAAAVHATTAVPAPSVTTGGSATVTAAAVSRTATVPTPSVSAAALTVTLKASGVVDEVTTAAAASEVLGAITFAAGSIVLVIMGGVKGQASGTLTNLRASASGLTFTAEAGASQAGQDTAWLRALSAPHTSGGSTVITIDSNGMTAYGLFYAIYEIAGYNTADPVGAVAQAAQSATLDGSYSITLSGAPASSSIVIAAITADTSAGASTVDPGTGWTEDVEIDSTASFFGFLQLERRTGSTSTTVTWNDIKAGASPTLWSTAAVAVEIKF